MSGKVVKRPVKRRAGKAYKLPDPIATGEILSDMTKKNWILGTSIGKGGFGEIYSAAPYTGKTPKEYPNVIKIEPHGNGPLFVEMHFYMRNAKPDEIDDWRSKKKLSSLGMPRYIGSGSHEYKSTKYRFIVMDRYGTDLWKLFEQNNRSFPEHTVYKIALQIVNVLEYIHHKTYVHADIKGANLLLDLKSQNQVYLVDFGLASHYTKNPDYKLDPKKAHNGTIEYTSRDAHMGVPTMRGDFEILGYNMIQWLCGSLPWEKNLSDQTSVQQQKEKAFEDIPEFLNKCFHNSVPEPVLKYMTLLGTLKFNETPDYEKFRKILTDGLKQLSHKPNGELEFSARTKTTSNAEPVTPKRAKKPTPKLTPKTTPQKVKKTIVPARKSPRAKLMKTPSPMRNNLDDSNAGVVLDMKRGGANDIKRALDDIKSDEEYDVMIVRKTKRRAATATSKIQTRTSPVRNNRRKVNYSDSTDSEPEVLPSGTRSRNTKKQGESTNKAPARKLTNRINDSDEDMFDT